MTIPKTDPPAKAIDARRQQERALAADRQRILALPPEKALDAVLSHPFPVTLVQSLAEEDLHLLVHAIGPDDALPVLGLASNAQWEFLLDLEIWTRDRIHGHHLTEWLARLLQADPDRFTHWITGEQRDVLEYYLFRHIELHLREYEEDPGEIGDGYSTEDDVHYIRMRPYPDLHRQEQAHRDQFLGDLLRRISVYDVMLYRNLLLASAGMVGAETEEELLRLRNVRLAEKGFLPFEEAVGVYQPLTVSELRRRGGKPPGEGGRPVASYPLVAAFQESPAGMGRFGELLARIQDETLLQRLQTELAALCNRVIVADLQQVRERDTLARVVAKVAGYIGIGLEMAETDQAADAYAGAALLQTHLLADIFRVGYGRALQLKWRAERWHRGSWFHRNGRPLSFWGESWMGLLGGLLIKKPLYFDNYRTGERYREFSALADIQGTETTLDRIMAVDRLLSRMALGRPRPAGEGLVTYRNFLLTAWANHVLGVGLEESVPPLDMGGLRRFCEHLWPQEASQPRRIRDSMRQNLLDWLATRSGWDTAHIAEHLGWLVDGLCDRIEAELGAVATRDLDPRHVQALFLIGGDHS